MTAKFSKEINMNKFLLRAIVSISINNISIINTSVINTCIINTCVINTCIFSTSYAMDNIFAESFGTDTLSNYSNSRMFTELFDIEKSFNQDDIIFSNEKSSINELQDIQFDQNLSNDFIFNNQQINMNASNFEQNNFELNNDLMKLNTLMPIESNQSSVTFLNKKRKSSINELQNIQFDPNFSNSLIFNNHGNFEQDHDTIKSDTLLAIKADTLTTIRSNQLNNIFKITKINNEKIINNIQLNNNLIKLNTENLYKKYTKEKLQKLNKKVNDFIKYFKNKFNKFIKNPTSIIKKSKIIENLKEEENLNNTFNAIFLKNKKFLTKEYFVRIYNSYLSKCSYYAPKGFFLINRLNENDTLKDSLLEVINKFICFIEEVSNCETKVKFSSNASDKDKLILISAMQDFVFKNFLPILQRSISHFLCQIYNYCNDTQKDIYNEYINRFINILTNIVKSHNNFLSQIKKYHFSKKENSFLTSSLSSIMYTIKLNLYMFRKFFLNQSILNEKSLNQLIQESKNLKNNLNLSHILVFTDQYKQYTKEKLQKLNKKIDNFIEYLGEIFSKFQNNTLSLAQKLKQPLSLSKFKNFYTIYLSDTNSNIYIPKGFFSTDQLKANDIFKNSLLEIINRFIGIIDKVANIKDVVKFSPSTLNIDKFILLSLIQKIMFKKILPLFKVSVNHFYKRINNTTHSYSIYDYADNKQKATYNKYINDFIKILTKTINNNTELVQKVYNSSKKKDNELFSNLHDTMNVMKRCFYKLKFKTSDKDTLIKLSESLEDLLNTLDIKLKHNTTCIKKISVYKKHTNLFKNQVDKYIN